MKITNFRKLAFAIVACALPLAANSQNTPLASDSKMMKDGKMMSDGKMMIPATPKIGDMVSDFTLKTFENEAGRQSHLTGAVAAALMSKASDLLAKPPQIIQTDVLSAKVPQP